MEPSAQSRTTAVANAGTPAAFPDENIIKSTVQRNYVQSGFVTFKAVHFRLDGETVMAHVIWKYATLSLQA